MEVAAGHTVTEEDSSTIYLKAASKCEWGHLRAVLWFVLRISLIGVPASAGGPGGPSLQCHYLVENQATSKIFL